MASVQSLCLEAAGSRVFSNLSANKKSISHSSFSVKYGKFRRFSTAAIENGESITPEGLKAGSESKKEGSNGAANPFVGGKLSSRFSQNFNGSEPESPSQSAFTASAVSTTPPVSPAAPTPPVSSPVKSEPKANKDAAFAPPKSSFAGTKVLAAFKEGDKFESGTKTSRPMNAPKNIFDDPRRTKEEIEAEKWRFALNQEQVLIALSFVATSLLMLLTVFVVWKLGAIHYNEY